VVLKANKNAREVERECNGCLLISAQYQPVSPQPRLPAPSTRSTHLSAQLCSAAVLLSALTRLTARRAQLPHLSLLSLLSCPPLPLLLPTAHRTRLEPWSRLPGFSWRPPAPPPTPHTFERARAASACEEPLRPLLARKHTYAACRRAYSSVGASSSVASSPPSASKSIVSSSVSSVSAEASSSEAIWISCSFCSA
jgi:hypothetical protein